MKEPSPSLIIVKLRIDNEKIKDLMAGGKGILNRQLEVEINISKSAHNMCIKNRAKC